MRENDPKRRFFRPCLLHAIGRCTAPCADRVSRERYRADIEPRGQQVTIIRFDAAAADPPRWRWRMEACRISAEQKVRAFDHVGFAVEHLALTASTSRAQFAALLAARNQDPATAAVIVQLPGRCQIVCVQDQ